MSEDTGRISVSRDALRAELATLKLDLIQTLATKDDVKVLEARVGTLETDVDRLKTWRKSLAGVVAVLVAFAIAVSADVTRHYL